MSHGPAQTLIVYGNCQAGALAGILGTDPVIAAAFRVIYYPSFDDRVPGSKDLSPDDVGAAALLLEQFDPQPFPYRDQLSASCARVVFPAIDLNLLWPLTCANPFNDEPAAETPWGHFPYGDRVIVDCVQQGTSLPETLAFYREHSAEKLPDARRYSEMELARLRSRETKCDIVMSDFVFDRLRYENLFWCVNHPGMALLRELCRRLLGEACARVPVLSAVDIDATIAGMDPAGPLGFYRVPFHPLIVDAFDLQWYRNEEGPNYGLRATPLTYDQYMHAMTETSIAVRSKTLA